jgi:hypothetical protein
MLIDRLKTAGKVKADWDFRSGDYIDRSGNGYDYTIDSAFPLLETGMGAKFLAINTQDFDIPITASFIGLSQWGIEVYVKFADTQSDGHQIYQDRITGGKNRVSLRLGSNGSIGLTGRDDGDGVSKTWVAGVAGDFNFGEWVHIFARFDSVSDDHDLWINGVKTRTTTLAADAYDADVSDDISIGSTGASFLVDGHVGYLTTYNTKITDAEIPELYSERTPMKWATKTSSKFSNTDGSGDLEGWKTDYGASVNKTNVISGFLDDTPYIATTGAWRISTDTINGQNIKMIDCKTSGVLSIPTSEFGQTSAEAAYGKWEFWINHADASETIIGFINSVAGAYSNANQDGYSLWLDSSERLIMKEVASGSETAKGTTATGYFAAATWHKITITRSGAGAFTLYLNDTIVTVSTGDNPFTDTTFTTSNYINFDIDAGDKIAYADVTGNHAFVKYITA